LIEIKDLTVTYGDAVALSEVSIQVGDGELVSIVGSNGSGKTTLLRSISGLKQIRSGEIKFLDKRIDVLPPHEIAALGLSHVPEGRRIFPFMTVEENLQLGAYRTEAQAHWLKNINGVYEIFPRLKERSKQNGGTLSGGEQQMLAIGRALMSEPKLLMLDEPSLGLSPLFVQTIFKTIQAIGKEGMTILIVEQNVRAALRLANHAYVLENGRNVLSGTGKELLENDQVRRTYLGIA
jgi:branched-chain amino acid transport system ATP-binding protein